MTFTFSHSRELINVTVTPEGKKVQENYDRPKNDQQSVQKVFC